MYEIQVKTRKHPDWGIIYLVPASGDSRPARFQGKEEAKAALQHLRDAERETARYRTPSTRREFKMVKTEGALTDLPYITPERAVAYL